MMDAEDSRVSAEDAAVVKILISHSNKPYEFAFPTTSTVKDLQDVVSSECSIAPEYQKLIAPKMGILRDPSASITSLPQSPKKIILMGSSAKTMEEVNAMNAPGAHKLRKYGGTGPIAPAKPTHRRDWKKESEESQYTFHTLNPLSHLPNPERSRQYLARLRDDPGIRAVMKKHKFSVPLLSEMDPAEHTTHELRTLGLNKNAGQEILLRLRTDAYDGYRHYDTVRKTLCHELAHNVHGPHDRNFWDLYKVIVKEVEAADWASGGRTINGGGGSGRSAMTWAGDEEEKKRVEGEDGGGWTGGTFRLGGGGSNPSGNSATTAATIATSAGNEAVRREAAARAAEARMKRAGGGAGEGNAGSS